MRILPRIHIPKLKLVMRKLRKLRRRLTIARAVFLVELLAFASALAFILTGPRAAAMDRAGRRADVVALAAVLLLFGLLHLVLSRRIVPALERRFAPAPYDERRILFDLGQEARTAVNIDQLYRSVIKKIGEALDTENVSIFVREDSTGDYLYRISATEKGAAEPVALVPQARQALARNAFVVKRLRNLAQPLVIEPGDYDVWSRAFNSSAASVREARQKELEMLKQIKANLLLQVRIKDQMVGILSIGPRRSKHQYSAADKEMLMSVAGQLAFVIENSKLIERIVAEERLLRELALAAEVQQRLFPARAPASSCFDLAGFCQPARGVGGDYYDFLPFDNGEVGIAVADVAGKGISAALLMSSVQASLRSQAVAHNIRAQQSSPVDIVAAINSLLCKSTGSATYVTFFYAHMDEATRQLTYVNAGHNPPFLLRTPAAAPRSVTGELAPSVEGAVALADAAALKAGFDDETMMKAFLKLTTGGPVIGMFDHFRFEQETIQLESGDLLVAFTDGVTEALNTAGEEFGEERLQHALIAASHLPAGEVRDNLVKCVGSWCAGATQHDDLTFIVLKVK